MIRRRMESEHMVGEPLFSPRTRTRVGDYGVHGKMPVALIKAGKNEDYMSIVDFAELLYGFGVREIILADGRRVA